MKFDKSLRFIFGISFVLCAILPMVGISIYFVYLHNQSLENEVVKRLDANQREVQTLFEDLEGYLRDQTLNLAQDQNLLYQISFAAYDKIQKNLENYLNQTSIHSLSIFDEEGFNIFSTIKTKNGVVSTLGKTAKALSSDSVIKLKTQDEIIRYNLSDNTGFAITIYKNLYNEKKEKIAIVRESVYLDQKYFLDASKRMGTEFLLLKKDFKPLLASQADLVSYPAEYFRSKYRPDNENYFAFDFKGKSYAYQIYPLSNIENTAYLALGISLEDQNLVKEKMYIAIASIVFIIGLFLIPVLFFISRWLLQPIERLAIVTRKISEGQKRVEIPVNTRNEVGLLTYNFNTMSKKLEDVNRELETNLVDLRDSNKKLQDAQSTLVQSAKMASLGQLVAGVAHELNNPIAFITSNVEFLDKYVNDLSDFIENPPATKEQLEKKKFDMDWEYMRKDLPKLIQACREGAQRTTDIVKNLRTFSRQDKGQKEIVDIKDLIDATLQLLASEKHAGVKVETSFQHTHPVDCNRNQINQVLVNILVNAFHATPKNGKVSIRTSEKKYNHKEMLSIQIQDTGSGIKPEDLSKIFDPFFTTKDVGQGTGLGLSITYSIVTEHGGEILVDSKLAEGSTFEVLLPL